METIATALRVQQGGIMGLPRRARTRGRTQGMRLVNARIPRPS
jgi:hypothetical protein